MLLKSIQDLPPRPERAVIINVGTKWVTTLALLSALKYTGMPILIIDCEYGDGSFEHFREMMETHEFDLLSAPLKKHGHTLDWLFENIRDEKVLLIDSDVEILNAEIIALARRVIDGIPDGEILFGAGFSHGPCWLHDHVGFGYYQERMWIPLTLLKPALVREALRSGFSFIDRAVWNDFAPSRLISRILGLRFRIPLLKKVHLSWLNPFKRTYYGQKPSYVYYDTGADIFQHLKYDRGMFFAGIPGEIHRLFVTHFHGITRKTLDPDIVNAQQNGGMREVLDRLKTVYGVIPE
jgi:glycosyltransferase involved in cell wall biosynthesis